MELNVDLSRLWGCVHAMGAEKLDFNLGEVWSNDDLELDAELDRGKDIDLAEVDSVEGLLNYHGRQVLLFIPDHGQRVEKAIDQPSQGNKFHISDCEMLEKMRQRNRFERYKVTNNVSGIFEIFGTSRYTNGVVEGAVALNVCKYCLRKLNFKDADNVSVSARNQIVNEFSLEEFFSTYSSLFRYYPKGHVKDAKKGYADDWKEVSRQFRTKHNYTCSHCDVNLGAHKGLLHVHHMNGEKSDNSDQNLKALCADCHRKEPYHEHMYVKHADVQLINRVRREQGLLKNTVWDDAFQYADPACHGVLLHCKANNYSVPEVGYEVVDSIGQVTAEFELAWVKKKVAVVLDKVDVVEGWRVMGLSEATTFFGRKLRN